MEAENKESVSCISLSLSSLASLSKPAVLSPSVWSWTLFSFANPFWFLDTVCARVLKMSATWMTSSGPKGLSFGSIIWHRKDKTSLASVFASFKEDWSSQLNSFETWEKYSSNFLLDLTFHFFFIWPRHDNLCNFVMVIFSAFSTTPPGLMMVPTWDKPFMVKPSLAFSDSGGFPQSKTVLTSIEGSSITSVATALVLN